MKNLITVLILVVWIGLIALGAKILLNYDFKSGPQSSSIKHFPKKSKLKLDPKLETILIFVHPNCPCSSASLEELNRLITNSQGKLKTIIIFIKPDGSDDKWLDTALWNKAKSMKVETYIDQGNREAKIFQTKTSGEVFLFNPKGDLLFHGGITASRGHEGDNQGEESIDHYLKDERLTVTKSPVFGCQLF